MHEFQPTYNLFLVGLSFLVSIFGSYTGILLVKAGKTSTEYKNMWIALAALALGGGAIWTMHFIGMLAYAMGMPVSYDGLITVASLAIAVIVVWLGLYFVSTRQTILRLLIAGFITGIGVASMHYSGMYAIKMPGEMTYDPTLFSISIVIAVVAATAALWLALNLEGTMQMLGAAVIMGIAVCGMHYTGMFAMQMINMDHSVVQVDGIKPLTLGLFIFCFTMLLLVLCLIVAMTQISRRMYEDMERDDEDENNATESAFGNINLSTTKAI